MGQRTGLTLVAIAPPQNLRETIEIVLGGLAIRREEILPTKFGLERLLSEPVLIQVTRASSGARTEGPSHSHPLARRGGKDESGKGRWGYGYYRSYNYDRDYKQEFSRSRCKVERKWERNGECKEKRKCKGGYGW